MKKNNCYIVLFSIILSIVSCWVILSDSIYLGHDTLFHLSRIEGYAQSLANGHIFPDIYLNKNDGFGYGSALFYCDFFLLVPALLYLSGLSLTTSYTFYIFSITLLTCFSIIYACKQLTTNPLVTYMAITLFLLSPYRITNIYTRGAVGEVTAMMATPIIIGALAKLFIFKKNATVALVLGLVGLLFSHNLSFALWCCVIVILVAINYKVILDHSNVLRCLIISPIIAFCLTTCFTFPLLEQTNAQQLYLHYYATNSDLNKTAQPFWSLFNPFTMVNGHSGYSINFDQTLNVSLGWITTLLPLLHFLLKDTASKTMPYIKQITILGYCCLVLSTGIINFDLLPQLKIIQFAFRFISIALPMLSLSGAIALCNYFYYPKYLKLTITCLILFGFAYQIPYRNIPISINSTTTYDQLLDGSIVDPYFGNSSYVRVEVAGADYLPIGGLNTKNMSHDVIEVANNHSIPISSDSQFTITSPGAYILPKTYYKGYQVCDVANNCQLVEKSNDGRCFVSLINPGAYTIVYQKTTMHKLGIIISLMTSVVICVFIVLNRLLRR